MSHYAVMIRGIAYLLTVGTGQRYLLLHNFFTELDQLGQLKLDGQAQHFQHQLDINET